MNKIYIVHCWDGSKEDGWYPWLDKNLSNEKNSVYRFDMPNTANPKINEWVEFLNKQVDCLILVDKIKIINTKKGDKMAFLTGSDETTTKEFTIFPKVLKMFPEIKRGDLVKVRIKVERRLNEYQLIVEKMKYLQGEENEE